MTGAQLQRLLDKMGESQVGMAKRLGISDRNMRRYVAGELPVPRVVEIAVRCMAEHMSPVDRSLAHVKHRIDSEKE
jgi:hypothetical protein